MDWTASAHQEDFLKPWERFALDRWTGLLGALLICGASLPPLEDHGWLLLLILGCESLVASIYAVRPVRPNRTDVAQLRHFRAVRKAALFVCWAFLIPAWVINELLFEWVRILELDRLGLFTVRVGGSVLGLAVILNHMQRAIGDDFRASPPDRQARKSVSVRWQDSLTKAGVFTAGIKVLILAAATLVLFAIGSRITAVIISGMHYIPR